MILLEKSQSVIARSVFCDEAISLAVLGIASGTLCPRNDSFPTRAFRVHRCSSVSISNAHFGVSSTQKSARYPWGSLLKNCLTTSGFPSLHPHSYTVARPVTAAGMLSAVGFVRQ